MYKNKQSQLPILSTLQDYLSKDPIRMHVPFHSGVENNSIFPKELYNLDISEVSGYDVSGEDNPIYQSEKITASFFNVSHTFYLTGGASSGLLAAMIALNKYGKKVLLARNVHKSVINGVILSGLEPVWIDVAFLEEWNIFSRVDPNKVQEAIVKNPDIAGCVIVSPTYEGVLSDVKAIAEICHRNNIPLIVDEAHGAHLYFLNSNHSLQSSLCYGADLVIQSWHKSLGSLTQTGVLHLINNSFFTYNDVKRSLDLVSSTSPSFLLLLSLELTRNDLVETDGSQIKSLFDQANFFRSELEKIEGVKLFNNDDSFKIYLKPSNQSGVDFAYNMYKNYSIEVESANEIGFLMLVGKNFTDKIQEKIKTAINKICCIEYKPFLLQETMKPSLNEFEVNPREAFMSGFKNKEKNKYECEIYAPCPPGYVVSVPGTVRTV